MTTPSSWIKVAQGFRLVVQAASKITVEESGKVATSATRHGIDLTKNVGCATAQAASTYNILMAQDLQHSYNHNNDSNVISSLKNSAHTVQEEHNIVRNMDTSVASSVENDGRDNPDHEVTKNSINNISGKHDKENSNKTDIPNLNEVETKERKVNENNLHQALHIDNAVDEGLQKPPQEELNHPHYLKEGKAVPSTRIGRAMGFASLGVGLAAGTAFEVASRVVSRVTDGDNNNQGSVITNDANSDRLAKTLCRMRGAALKLGQMLSIQDETLLPQPLAKALEQVRQGADAMPLYQLQAKLKEEFGEDWKDKFVSFSEMPFAAASIGQVHLATITSEDDQDQQQLRKVVVKCQYPGVADSIDSDLNNLSMIVKMTGMTPPGLFIDEVIRVGREELIVECNYLLEAENQNRFRKLVEDDDELSKAKFKVPAVINGLTTANVLTTEYCPGGTIDKVAFLDQEERNRIGRNIMRLTMKELFTWRFMQTDPNWGNFLYDVGTGTTFLIDFGSAREYSKSFVDGYLRIVWASANQDTETLMSQSHKMGFLTGEENEIMLNAHKMSGFTVGEPFASNEEYDFANSGITGRISEHGSHFLQHRLTPPPEEVYTLHRKLAGAYNLCIKLGANIQCRDLLEEIVENHVFEDGQDHPLQ